jgi:hypothetical protein
MLLENLERAGVTSGHLTDDSFKSAFAFAIGEKRITIVTPLRPEQLQAQLAATKKTTGNRTDSRPKTAQSIESRQPFKFDGRAK